MDDVSAGEGGKRAHGLRVPEGHLSLSFPQQGLGLMITS